MDNQETLFSNYFLSVKALEACKVSPVDFYYVKKAGGSTLLMRKAGSYLDSRFLGMLEKNPDRFIVKEVFEWERLDEILKIFNLFLSSERSDEFKEIRSSLMDYIKENEDLSLLELAIAGFKSFYGLSKDDEESILVAGEDIYLRTSIVSVVCVIFSIVRGYSSKKMLLDIYHLSFLMTSYLNNKLDNHLAIAIDLEKEREGEDFLSLNDTFNLERLTFEKGLNQDLENYSNVKFSYQFNYMSVLRTGRYCFNNVRGEKKVDLLVNGMFEHEEIILNVDSSLNYDMANIREWNIGMLLEEIRRISDSKFKTNQLIENFNEEDIFEEAV